MPVIEAAAVLEERLIKVVDIERIRYAHFREGSSIRELARSLHHSRMTIRRALDDPGPWTYRRTRRRPAPVMDQVAPIIEAWLAADERVPPQAAPYRPADLSAPPRRARLQRRRADRPGVPALNETVAGSRRYLVRTNVKTRRLTEIMTADSRMTTDTIE